jgi:Flp pilus assembly protein TadG
MEALLMKRSSHKPNLFGVRAQAMVEFAIAAPILFALLFGVFEFGRMIFVYSAVTNSSREAVRYASVVGYDDYGEIKYKHCAGIREMARRSAYFMNLQDADITITYDHGPGTASFHTCTGTLDPAYFISSGDRVLVTVTAEYRPYTKLVPFGSRTLISSSARTILGYVKLASTSSVTPPPPTVPPTSMTTAPSDTPVASDTPTATPSNTPDTGPWYTQPPLDTATPGPSETPTDTPTVTPTSTLTPTPTMVTDCGNVTAGTISIPGNTTEMSMMITNPNPYSLTVQDIHVVWNAATGGPGGEPLTLQSITLAGVFWTVNDSSGNITIIPVVTVTIPENATTTIIFTFNNVYQNPNGSESLVIDLSTPGCESFPIHSP